jgi:hypothetical protein
VAPPKLREPLEGGRGEQYYKKNVLKFNINQGFTRLNIKKNTID